MPRYPSSGVVAFDGTGARGGTNGNGVGAHQAIGIASRSLWAGAAAPGAYPRTRADRRARLGGAGCTARRAAYPRAGRLDGEAEITILAGQRWPRTPILRCW